MPRFINPEDWFLVLTVFASLATFPIAIAAGARVFGVPLDRVFNRRVWAVVGQIVGIAAFILLLVQVGIDTDGLGAKLIYGRF
jgi:hypothetical protein